MGRNRLWPVLVLLGGLASLPGPARAREDVAAAMSRMAEADQAMQAGRPAAAFEGYLAVIKVFPTWWLPTVKAAAAARALRMPEASVDAWLARARTLEPSGDYLPLVTLLLALDRGDTEAVAALLPAGAVPALDGAVEDPAARRLSMARALAFERAGRVGAAVLEYRGLLARDPGFQAARFRLARLLAGQGRPDEAATMSTLRARKRTCALKAIITGRWATSTSPRCSPSGPPWCTRVARRACSPTSRACAAAGW